MCTKVYDVCVVGAGLWGSAAAMHCSQQQDDITVCLIGPKEPADEKEFANHSVYGAHYDEGRITRRLDADPIMTTLAARSIERYEQLQHSSGIPFHYPVGYLLCTQRDRGDITKAKQTADRLHNEYITLNKSKLNDRFPYLNIFSEMEDCEAVLEYAGAGYISPRNYLKALQYIAVSHRCDIIDKIVESVTETDNSTMTLVTEDGEVVKAKKVLLCTGAFTPFKHLLPEGLTLDMETFGRKAVRLELGKKDVDKLKDMPSIYALLPGKVQHEVYILPPILYPDGKYYVKIGNLCDPETPSCIYTQHSQLLKHFRQPGDQNLADILKDGLCSIIIGLEPLSTKVDNCVLSRTPTKHLYCGLVSPHLGVLCGCQGAGAKSADEIGLIGAKMILAGKWDHDLPQEKFSLRFKNKNEADAEHFE